MIIIFGNFTTSYFFPALITFFFIICVVESPFEFWKEGEFIELHLIKKNGLPCTFRQQIRRTNVHGGLQKQFLSSKPETCSRHILTNSEATNSHIFSTKKVLTSFLKGAAK